MALFNLYTSLHYLNTVILRRCHTSVEWLDNYWGRTGNIVEGRGYTYIAVLSLDFVEDLRKTTKNLSLGVGLRAKMWTLVCVYTQSKLWYWKFIFYKSDPIMGVNHIQIFKTFFWSALYSQRNMKTVSGFIHAMYVTGQPFYTQIHFWLDSKGRHLPQVVSTEWYWPCEILIT
jgi:hypothetical protein